MLNRRRFLTATTGVAATLAMSRNLLAQLEKAPTSLPDPSKYSGTEDAYWEELRKLYLIPEDEIYLNNGTVGSSPAPVLRAVFDAYNTLERLDEKDPEDYPVWGYAAWNEFRDPLAAFIGCNRDELALLRNATEANNYIANGIDMKAGDEVLITDQEHPSGEQPWQLRAKRYGIVVKKVALPIPVQNPAQVLNLFNDAITPRTKVIFFSHITTVMGTVLPVKEICALARSKGVLSAVDGAHVTGMMKFNVHDLGCDFYSSSPHKWLQAPKGCGFLYMRDEVIDRLWNTITSGSWDDTKMRAERFQHIGSSNLPVLFGLRAAIQLANNIGMDRIEQRHRELNNYILAAMTKHGAESWSSPDPAMRCGIAAVNAPPIQVGDIEHWMWSTSKIRIRGGGGGPYKIRLSTPYYLRKREIDRFVEKFDEYKRTKVS